ncbi:MAG TPA: RdgB/HAM1 family non-canonical purine NTP pyrophosphatase [Nevskiaceae bacterium]|nr:RdgB/HAM1 family non-canonical purine NTP pyrophosphatase [Nevskiaceae bacterium]
MDVVLASRNRGKLAELQSLLAPLNFQLRLASDFTGEIPEETGDTFEANALLKAEHAARASGLPAIADDSGIEVDALEGAPGVRSARFAGDHATDAQNNQKLLRMLENAPDADRGAQFVCVMAFVRGGDKPILARSRWRGSILRAPRGTNGFGYDPLFFVPTHGCASAELPPAEKNRISHRAQAVAALIQRLRG